MTKEDPEPTPRSRPQMREGYLEAYSMQLNQHPGSKSAHFWEGVCQGMRFCRDAQTERPVCPRIERD